MNYPFTLHSHLHSQGALLNTYIRKILMLPWCYTHTHKTLVRTKPRRFFKKKKKTPWSHVTDLANSFYLHRNVYTHFLCTQKILSVYTYMVPTYFTINSILILFLEENKKMLQNISHQPQNYKSTWRTQSKSFKPVLPHTKPSTLFTKD